MAARKAAESPIDGVLRTLKTGRTFFLAGHARPDGDTLGSALALSHALKAMGKKPEIYTGDPIPDSLTFLPGMEMVKVQQKATKSFDAAILLECSTPERMGPLMDLKKQAKVVINIDHHKTAQAYGTYNLIDPASSSNAEQVLEILKELKAPITQDIATCLYVGMATDTGRFHYSNTTPQTLRTAADLLETGLEAWRINDRVFATRSLPALKLLGRALEKLKLECAGRVALIPLSRADFEDAGADLTHSEEIVNFGLQPPGVWASALLKEGKDRVFVSLRARGRVDVSAVAQQFGGGGHENASGCQFAEPLAKAALRIEAALCQAIKAKEA